MRKWIAMFAALLLMISVVPALAQYTPGDYRGSDPMGNTAIVVSQRVTLRDQPSYSGKTLARITGGETVSFLLENNGWAQAKYVDPKGKEYTGWLLTKYLVVNPVVLTLRESNVPALCAPDPNAKNVGSLPKYTVLPVIATWGNYYIVSMREASGFVPMSVKAWTDAELQVYEKGPRLNLRVVRDSMLRIGSGTQWAEVDTAKAGSILQGMAAAPENGWYPVRYDKKFVAFVNAADVEIAP